MKTFTDPEVFARVRRLPTYVLNITDRVRDAAVARGVDVVDFSMGNPDGAPPPRVVEGPGSSGATASSSTPNAR